MSLTAEELALLRSAEDTPGPGRRRTRRDAPAPDPAPEPPAAAQRGPYTPIQHDDDGWGDLPVQHRG